MDGSTELSCVKIASKSLPNRTQIALFLPCTKRGRSGGHLADKDLTSPVAVTFTSPVFVLRRPSFFPRCSRDVATMSLWSVRHPTEPSTHRSSPAVGVSGIRQCHPKSGSTCGILKHLHIPTWHKITNSVLCEPSSQSHLTRRSKHAARM